MRPFTRLVWKEARELLRPRYVLPILMLPVFFVAMGQGLGGVEEQLEDPAKVGVLDEDDDELGAVLERSIRNHSTVVYNGTGADPQRALNRTAAEGGTALIVIPSNFTERLRNDTRGRLRLYTQVDSVSLVGIASSAKVEDVLDSAGRTLTMNVTGATATQLDPLTSDHTTYVKGERIDAPPGAISAAFSTQFIFVPVVILFTVIFSGQMVMNSMASEKENKTLETLLSMPVRRHHIVGAKLVGGSVIGLFATALYTGGLAFTQFSVGASFGTGAVSLGGVDYLLIGVSLFFALVGTLAVALALGMFADNQQGAQMLLFPLSGLAIVPMFVTMFADFDTLGLPVQAVLFAIPFTHPIIAPKQLLFGDAGLVFAGIAYLVVFGVGAVVFVVKLFDSDRPMTGNAGWLNRLIELSQR